MRTWIHTAACRCSRCRPRQQTELHIPVLLPWVQASHAAHRCNHLTSMVYVCGGSPVLAFEAPIHYCRHIGITLVFRVTRQMGHRPKTAQRIWEHLELVISLDTRSTASSTTLCACAKKMSQITPSPRAAHQTRKRARSVHRLSRMEFPRLSHRIVCQ
jgi:hypothetical protein